jgi:tetratricopeptide (TPR) repeat protein
LTVRVTRRDVVVRSRRGYVASPRPRAEPTASTAAARPPAGLAPSGADPIAPLPGAIADVIGPPSPMTRNAIAAPAPGVRVRPDAARHVDLLLRGGPADAAAKAGWDAYERGDVVAARTSLTTAAASNSVRPWVHYALGLSEYALKEFRESATEWEGVRQAVPEFEPVYFDLVDSYLQLKDHDQALRVLRAAQDRWPYDPDVFNALGVVQTSRGSLDEAVKSFQRAVAVAPNEGVGYFNLGHALELRYVRSRRYVQQLRSWVSNDRDRSDAIENYRKYLSLGGPLEQSAQEGLTRLQWWPSRN